MTSHFARSVEAAYSKPGISPKRKVRPRKGLGTLQRVLGPAEGFCCTNSTTDELTV